jgi:hypothetical protein
MLGSRKPPPICPSNSAGMGIAGKVSFANAERSWTEHFDLIDVAAAALKRGGHSVTIYETWFDHGESGFTIMPLLAELQPLEGGGVRTVTTMQVNHPTLVPVGVFEYQHSTGDNVVDSLSKGFDQWVQMDFVTLLDALRAEPELCSAMEMTFPAKNGKPELVRRAVLGPVTHMAQTPPDAQQEHPFCPCCLLTNSFEAFRDLFEDHAFYGLRLFAFRDGDHEPMADCRANGDDWEKGAQALRVYAGTWPPAAGYELRKQYVVLQTLKRDSRGTSQQA